MGRSLTLAAMLLCQLPSLQAASDDSSAAAAKIEDEIRSVGAGAFIDKHFEDSTWKRVLLGIESASPRWLAIGESLKSHADAGSSEELGDAFFAALANDPLGVLPTLTRIYKSNPEQLCSQTFDAQLPKQGIDAYLSAIEQGLRRAKTESERSIAAACKKGLLASRKYARENGLK